MSIIDLLLVIFCIWTVYTDIRYRKVFNFVTLSAILLGIGLNTMYMGLSGLKSSLLGMAAGFGILFLFYLAGGMGAGDVKFMAAVGAFKGAGFAVWACGYGAIIGGIAAVAALILKKRFIKTVSTVLHAFISFLITRKKESLVFNEADSLFLPYAVFLAAGVLLKLFV